MEEYMKAVVPHGYFEKIGIEEVTVEELLATMGDIEQMPNSDGSVTVATECEYIVKDVKIGDDEVDFGLCLDIVGDSSEESQLQVSMDWFIWLNTKDMSKTEFEELFKTEIEIDIEIQEYDDVDPISIDSYFDRQDSPKCQPRKHNLVFGPAEVKSWPVKYNTENSLLSRLSRGELLRD
ncbi:hypothetical protein GGF46_002405 [Coemansia sp. RSA 552]|nr:hypothetical protein GGF46_002405 [Coemansia sp. RSA 552]